MYDARQSREGPIDTPAQDMDVDIGVFRTRPQYNGSASMSTLLLRIRALYNGSNVFECGMGSLACGREGETARAQAAKRKRIARG